MPLHNRRRSCATSPGWDSPSREALSIIPGSDLLRHVGHLSTLNESTGRLAAMPRIHRALSRRSQSPQRQPGSAHQVLNRPSVLQHAGSAKLTRLCDLQLSIRAQWSAEHSMPSIPDGRVYIRPLEIMTDTDDVSNHLSRGHRNVVVLLWWFLGVLPHVSGVQVFCRIPGASSRHRI